MVEASFKRISSRDNALFRRIARLASSARERREQGATLLDGPHLVASYRAAGGTAEALVASESAYARAETRELFDAAPTRARALVSDRLFAEIAQVVEPVGLLAVIRTPEPPAPPARTETCLLLDGLDPDRSMLRTAATAGARHVFLSRGCVFAWSPKVLRAGQGAHFFLAIHERATLAEVAARHRGTVATTDVRSGVSLFDADLHGPVAWIFGSEGAGVSRELAGAANLRVRIPMPGPVESLNVAAAAAICLFEQVRQQSRS
jgi:TrmH family RNA methyltransferase